jgi:uncharacterized protein
MNNTLLSVIHRSLLLILVVVAPLAACDDAQSRSDSTLIIATRSARHTFTIELARTRSQMERGLMFREQLAADHGMLFLYDSDRAVAFWMKNTLIPLDLLFIGSDGTILQIAKRAVPLSTAVIAAQMPVRAVLEVNGGTADRLGIAVGDRVLYSAFGGG